VISTSVLADPLFLGRRSQIGTGAAVQGTFIFCFMVIFTLLLFMRSAAYHRGQSPWENNKRR